MSEIASDHLAELNAGRVEARTLTEALAIDHRLLLQAAIPDATEELAKAVEIAQNLGILKRMAAIGVALQQELSVNAREALAAHPSDTVRGWMCFATAADTTMDTQTLLSAIQPLADDPCFTVREWVWMSTRPRLVDELTESINLLIPWTEEESANLRRFASESLRPRGVWASHIAVLKQSPAIGEPLLEPLRSDPSRYVQYSVANWINDAAKTNPKWARGLCERWRAESPTAATTRITTRALRSLR